MIRDALELGEVKTIFASLIHSLGIVVVKGSADVTFPALKASAMTANRADQFCIKFQTYRAETCSYQKLTSGTRLRNGSVVAMQGKQNCGDAGVRFDEPVGELQLVDAC